MNNETAKRLSQMRVSNGLTVSELAEKLSISEEKINLWENAELSPDADELIGLAKLYNISVDKLLLSDVVTDGDSEKKERVDISFKNGIHVESDNDSVHIDRTGIHIKSSDGHTVNSDKGDPIVTVDGKEYSKSECKKKAAQGALISTIISSVVVIAYIFLGFIGYWHPGWLIFFLVPIVLSLIEAIKSRNANQFAYPVIVVAVYLCLGFFANLWHPSWVIFLTIPIYYSICACFKNN